MYNRVLDHSRLHIPFLLAVCLLLYFPFLGARDFWDQENMYAEVTRMMLLGKSWALPQMNGELWLEIRHSFSGCHFSFPRWPARSTNGPCG